MCQVMEGVLTAGFILVHPIPCGGICRALSFGWVCPVRAMERGRCSQSCYPPALDLGLLALQADLGCMEEQNALCSLQIREVMLIGVRETNPSN